MCWSPAIELIICIIPWWSSVLTIILSQNTLYSHGRPQNWSYSSSTKLTLWTFCCYNVTPAMFLQSLVTFLNKLFIHPALRTGVILLFLHLRLCYTVEVSLHWISVDTSGFHFCSWTWLNWKLPWKLYSWNRIFQFDEVRQQNDTVEPTTIFLSIVH